MNYQYTYLDHKERKKREYIEAGSLVEAREILKRRGVCLLHIQESKASRSRMSQEDVLVFSRQLALLLRSGLPLYESLLSLRDQNHKKHATGVISTCIDHVRVGKPLSQALGEYPDIFDAFYRNCIAAGEKISNLGDSLKSVIRVLEDKRGVSKKITASLSYPLVLTSVSVFVTVFFLVSVIPSLRDTFEGMEMNRFSLCVFGLSDWVCAYGQYMLTALGGACAGIFLSRKQPFWSRWKETVWFAVPVVRDFFVKLSLWRFFSIVLAILQGGGTLIDGLEFGCQAIPYEKLRQDVRQMIDKVVAGSSLSRELSQQPWVPSFVVSMVALGEESGELTEVFAYIVDMYREETQKILERIAAWSQPVILVVLGGVIGLIMLAILIPLTSGIQVL